ALINSALLDLASRGHLDQAIDKLDKAREQDPHNARIACDLAAAYLEQGREKPEAFLSALGAANAAIRLNPQMPEARFNLALALEKLSLTEQARTQFRAYLLIDEHSGWATEARQHLARLSRTSPTERWAARRPLIEAAARARDSQRIRHLLGG